MNLEQQQFYNYLQANLIGAKNWFISLQNIKGEYLMLCAYGLACLIFVVISIAMVFSKDKE